MIFHYRGYKFVVLCSVISLIVSPFKSHAQVSDDSPDYQLEEKFHEVYKKYNSLPTSLEGWEAATDKKKIFSYKIKKRDTLWDVSRTFFADPYYWPKVWALNADHIYNPHEINQKTVIKFKHGTEEKPPSFEVEETQQNLQVSKNKKDDKIAIPPPKKPLQSIVKELPESLPTFKMSKALIQPIIFEVKKKAIEYPISPIFMTSFVNDNAIEGVGKIIQTEWGAQTATEEHYVFITLKEPIAKNYYIISNKGQIIFDEYKGEKKLAPYLYEVEGEIQVLKLIDASKNIYRAKVTRAINHINVGSIIMEGSLKLFDPVPGKLSANISAKIIGIEGGSTKSTLLQNDSQVFINAGANQGVALGQTLPVYQKLSTRGRSLIVQSSDQMIAKLKIIHVANGYSTGFISELTDYVQVNDLVGGSDEMPILNEDSKTSNDLDDAIKTSKASPEIETNSQMEGDLEEGPVPAEKNPTQPQDPMLDDDLDF